GPGGYARAKVRVWNKTGLTIQFFAERAATLALTFFAHGQDLNPPGMASRYSTQNTDALSKPASLKIFKSSISVRGLSLSRASRSSRKARVEEAVRKRLSRPPAR